MFPACGPKLLASRLWVRAFSLWQFMTSGIQFPAPFYLMGLSISYRVYVCLSVCMSVEPSVGSKLLSMMEIAVFNGRTSLREDKVVTLYV